MAPQKNHFAVLGLEIGAGEEEIKKAYRKLAKQWHPDKNKDPGAEDKFKEISSSYEYLSSVDRREIHERDLRKPKAPPRPPPPSQPSQSSSSYPSSKPSTSSNTNYNNTTTGKPKASASSDSDKPKRPSSGPKSKGAKKPGAASWSESFTKNFGQRKSQKEAPKERKHPFFFSTSFDGDDDDLFSFTFEAFNDRKPSFNAEHTDDDIIRDVFKTTDPLLDDFFWTMNFGAGFNQPPRTSSKPKSRPRNVAPESGNARGLDDEYLFSPRSDKRPQSGGIKEPCPWCGKLFPLGLLDQHEDKCGKFEGSDDGNADDFDSDLDAASDSFVFPGHGQNRRQSWQTQHEDHINKVRRDKMRYKNRMASQGKRNSGFVLCPYCERSFSEETATRHITVCREHLKTYGKPLNTRQSDPKSYRPQEQWDQETARARANKYSKGVPKPNIPNPFPKPTDVPEDGNTRRFPQPRPGMNVDDILGGISGQSYGQGNGQASSSGGSTKPDFHRRPQGKSTYTEIHKSTPRQSQPRNAFSNRTNLDGATGNRKANVQTGYSHRKL